MLEKIFEKSACVKPWLGDAEKKANATRSFSAIPSTDFMIAAAIGDIIDPVTKRNIPVPMPAEGVIYIIQQNGWETLEFDELAHRLTEVHSNVSDQTKEMLKESEIHLVQQRRGGEYETPRDSVSPKPTTPKILEPT